MAKSALAPSMTSPERVSVQVLDDCMHRGSSNRTCQLLECLSQRKLEAKGTHRSISCYPDSPQLRPHLCSTSHSCVTCCSPPLGHKSGHLSTRHQYDSLAYLRRGANVLTVDRCTLISQSFFSDLPASSS